MTTATIAFEWHSAQAGYPMNPTRRRTVPTPLRERMESALLAGCSHPSQQHVYGWWDLGLNAYEVSETLPDDYVCGTFYRCSK